MSLSLLGVVLFLTAVIVVDEILSMIALHPILMVLIAVGFIVPAACFAYVPARMRRDGPSHPHGRRLRR